MSIHPVWREVSNARRTNKISNAVQALELYEARDVARFMERVEKAECWEWAGRLNEDGYGMFGIGKAHVVAHRFSYTVHVGPIPSGTEIDHLCRNRRCVRPEHLEAVTHRVNVDRGNVGYRGAWTHCPRGHEFNTTNTYVSPSTGKRYCRACKNAMRRIRRSAA